MIIVLSQDKGETTTEAVLDWIEALGGDCIRINGEDFHRELRFSFSIKDGKDTLLLRHGEMPQNVPAKAIWFRRWHSQEKFGIDLYTDDHQFSLDVESHLRKELSGVLQALTVAWKSAPWLTSPREIKPNKLEILRIATSIGLNVPATLVTNNKDDLSDFMSKHPEIITKALTESEGFHLSGSLYLTYTAEVLAQDVNTLPQLFFPSLFQEKLQKLYELRVFFLDGDCYTMALFTQKERRSSIDSRNYSRGRPIRGVPYNLPSAMKEKIAELMSRLGLTTGSIDLVYTHDRRYVFLEVNPVGQFEFVSERCNYGLEKKVAQSLIRRAAEI